MADRCIEIKGLNDTLRWMDKMPENCLKITRKAMQDAAKATAKQVRQRTPKRWRALAKQKVKLYGKGWQSGEVVAKMGWIDNDQKSSSTGKTNPPTDWFKAYWQNYGTLAGRDPNHSFKEPVKHGKTAAAKRRKNRAGLQHQNFYEKSIEGWHELFMKTYEASMVKYQDEFRKH